MMKLIRGLIIFIAVFILLILAIMWGMGKTIDARPEYKQSDFFSYHYFTDDEIQNAPRISADYSFKFRAQDGMVPLMSSIIFKNVKDDTPLKKYVESLGYKYMGKDETYGDHWKDMETNTTFWLWVSKNKNEVILTKETYY
ncbi:hypothetical protein FJU30_04975 [Affinibrenneria salicis]|uniref:Uncharacterized protein n=1 Tax=Affinibrenneria salicis TaxID=2590031 RepID=A0A5J5G3Q5_9GAMM|nr:MULTISPECIES: hypothetical protein [Pectobacteriaceae]KAA9001648.1 hypothetical protein FJU30_04975 [Affinibrenneria salicis]PWC22820.1 hypothetical protein DDT52_00690 [Brenneria roseae subsp. roseae]